MRRRAALAALLLALAPVAAGAQQGCQFVEGSGNLSTVDLGGGSITYVRTPNLSCRDGVRIRADSAVAFQSSNYVQLIGRVRFEDAERRLTAQSAEYFTTVGRLQAHTDAVLVQKTDSSVVRGDEMIYNRAGPERARAHLEVYGDRPVARLVMRPGADTAGVPLDTLTAPYDIEADRILIEGDDYFRARGRVEIVRQDLRAFADSVEYDQVAGTLRLYSHARMVVNGRELSAQDIAATLVDGDLSEVEARRDAVLTSEDIRLRAPLVHVYFAAGAMERLVAVPLGPPVADPAPPVAPSADLPPADPTLTEADRARPVASAEAFTIEADSLDVLSPGEALDRIYASGNARAESSARDSLNSSDTPPFARTDWMEGDTIVATFERNAPVDSAAAPQPDSALAAASDSTGSEYRLERLSATGSARSLYRMAAGDSARARGDRRPAIHYVTAQVIVLEMNQGEVRHMEVTGQTEGVHAAPSGVVRDTLAVPRPDSARVDSVVVRGAVPSPPAAPRIRGRGR